MRVGLPTCFPLSFRRRLCIHCPKYSELHSMGQISHDKLVVAQQVDKLLVLCNTKVHYRVYKNPLPVPNLIHMSPFHALQSCFFEIGFVTLPSKSRSTKCSVFAKLSRQNPASVFLLCHPSHPPWFAWTKIFARSTDHETSRYALYFNLLSSLHY